MLSGLGSLGICFSVKNQYHCATGVAPSGVSEPPGGRGLIQGQWSQQKRGA